MSADVLDSPKVKHPRAAALAVVRELLPELRSACEKVIVAGSLRRKKKEVGDFLGRLIPANAMDLLLARWLADGTISQRLSKIGRATWGPSNKFAVHGASGIPIDFFATDHQRWYNMLVCRTGGEETNKAICLGAIERGWHWKPYAAGFVRKPLEKSKGPEYIDVAIVRSEKDVFDFAGLPYLEPEERK